MHAATSEASAGWCQAFERAWRGVGAAGDSAGLCTQVLDRYAEPHRRYHTQQHLGECLALFETARGLAVRPDEIELALWFHDAVYDLGRADNEARSAAWARHALTASGVPAKTVERVHRLVMVTLHTAVPEQADEQLLVDIDLAILGAPAGRFAEYEQQIRAEYAHVPEALFKSKRRTILQAFLNRPQLYGTAHFQAVFEAQARANLQRALA